MRTLVTGGGGFLGRAIIERLLERGDSVRSFARGSYPDLAARGVDVVRGDVADARAVRQAVRGVEVVFHVAAKAGIWGREADFFRANVTGTDSVIRACQEEGISRLIYTSSPSVVFDGRDMEGVDESVPYAGTYLAHYPRTKALAEKQMLAANSAELATVALRPHLLWGPHDTQLTKSILARGRARTLTRIGNRDPLVDFTYVENAAWAHLLAADKLSPGARISGRPFFISQGEPVPLWGFINRLLAAGSLPPVQRTISPRLAYAVATLLEFAYNYLPLKGEPRLTRFLAEELCTAHWFNIDAARRDLDYSPVVSIDEGLARLRASLEVPPATEAPHRVHRRCPPEPLDGPNEIR
jgi:2-alkyl-3-oxoalkanoate reductase